jgi:glycosyltransferase involved in cell wall biosynthesis
MKPKVTIGVCVRNCSNTIKQTIESIIQQNFPHELMEIIFVDDGSDDDTLKIIKEYASKIDITTKIFHDDWMGIGHARNKVIKNANGDYIIWVDGDMVISKDFVKKQVYFMEHNLNVGIAKGQYQFSCGPNLVSTLEIYSRIIGYAKSLNGNKPRHLGTGACIYRLKAIAQAGGFDDNIKGYGEDWDAELRVRAAGWSFGKTTAQWRDYERLGTTYNRLWQRYVKRGFDVYYVCQKNKGLIKFHRMLPPATFLAGLLDAISAYKCVRKKVVFLLPFHYAFRAAAWCLGFIKAKYNI